VKNLFRNIGVFTLICVSFFITNKTATVIKENDPLMIKIKEEAKNYKVDAIDAKIVDNTIIPGLYGKKVNVNSSYSNMQKVGTFTPSLLIYDDIKPKISLKGTYNKYIVLGNPNKNMVSLIFLVDSDDNVDNTMRILEEKGIKANFFIDGIWLEKNNDELVRIAGAGHTIGSLGYNYDYTNGSFTWMNTLIKKASNQDNGYCYLEKPNGKNFGICTLMKNYTIIPNIVVNKNYLTNIESLVKPGSLIALEINAIMEKELPLIINYLISKGYRIETLVKHLDERLY